MRFIAFIPYCLINPLLSDSANIKPYPPTDNRFPAQKSRLDIFLPTSVKYFYTSGPARFAQCSTRAGWSNSAPGYLSFFCSLDAPLNNQKVTENFNFFSIYNRPFMAEFFIGGFKLLILIKLRYSIFAIFQDIAGLATQLTADTLERCEADGFGLASL